MQVQSSSPATTSTNYGHHPEIEEHHSSNLYGLFNVKVREDAAITGRAQPTDPLCFHWTNFSNLAVIFVAVVTVIWLIRSKWLKKRRVEAERKDNNKKIEVATLTKSEVESQVALHVDQL